MADLTTRYMDLELKNPIIAASSGLTDNLDNIKKCEDAGAAAVVMKSIFEEQIESAVDHLFAQSENMHTEMHDYLNIYGREEHIRAYLDEILKVKKNISIPVIGSINCVSPGSWAKFVKKLEATGIDGLELNVYVVPNDPSLTSEQIEQTYVDIFREVSEAASIPIALKLPPYLTTPGRFIRNLVQTGARSLVLFNRRVPFDIDIEKQQVAVKNVISAPAEMSFSLRTIAMLAGAVDCDLAAGTGIHDAEAVIKHLLAGADAVQLCSALYQNGIEFISTLLDGLNQWLDSHSIQSVNDIRGKLSYQNSANPEAYERAQYMKVFSGILKN